MNWDRIKPIVFIIIAAAVAMGVPFSRVWVAKREAEKNIQKNKEYQMRLFEAGENARTNNSVSIPYSVTLSNAYQVGMFDGAMLAITRIRCMTNDPAPITNGFGIKYGGFSNMMALLDKRMGLWDHWREDNKGWISSVVTGWSVGDPIQQEIAVKNLLPRAFLLRGWKLETRDALNADLSFHDFINGFQGSTNQEVLQILNHWNWDRWTNIVGWQSDEERAENHKKFAAYIEAAREAEKEAKLEAIRMRTNGMPKAESDIVTNRFRDNWSVGRTRSMRWMTNNVYTNNAAKGIYLTNAETLIEMTDKYFKVGTWITNEDYDEGRWTPKAVENFYRTNVLENKNPRRTNKIGAELIQEEFYK